MTYNEYTVNLYTKDIFFDMEMLSYGFSEVSGGAEVKRADRLALDTTSTSGERVVRRLVENRIADIKQHLQKYVQGISSSQTVTGNDTLEAGASYAINLRFPEEIWNNIVDPLAELMHEYVVNGALADYYTQMGAGVNVDSLTARCNADLVRMREIVNFRHYPAV